MSEYSIKGPGLDRVADMLRSTWWGINQCQGDAFHPWDSVDPVWQDAWRKMADRAMLAISRENMIQFPCAHTDDAGTQV